jgi:hypothetical protein
LNQEISNVVDINSGKVEEQTAKFYVLYHRCFGDITAMLRKAKVMPMGDLAAHNPSFTQMVINLKELREVAKQVSDLLNIGEDFTHLDLCISLTESLANSIESQCHDSLGSAVAALDQTPHI